jgi:hypothetical protein
VSGRWAGSLVVSFSELSSPRSPSKAAAYAGRPLQASRSGAKCRRRSSRGQRACRDLRGQPILFDSGSCRRDEVGLMPDDQSDGAGTALGASVERERLT